MCRYPMECYTLIAWHIFSEPNKPLCGRMEVKGFPTVKVFVDGKPPYDYPGQRNFKELYDLILYM